MAEVNVTELPPIILEDFTANDSFLIVDDGRVRRLTKTVFSEWVAANVQGVQGIQGVAGRDGARGVNGTSGTNGTNGLSAYQLAVANGFTGTLTQWFASFKGADGATAAKGDNGWSPVYKIETSAGGSHLKIIDWVGGTGTKPTTLGYLSEGGVVQNTLTATNLKGDKGDRGLQGDTGAQGIQGIQGVTGGTGVQGFSTYELAVANGYVGTEAEWLIYWRGGAQGIQGITGDTGLQGIQGETGIQGIQGDIGLQGIQGETGSSAYQIAVTNGYVGTESEWLVYWRGGAQGIQGETGVQGIQGVAGDNASVVNTRNNLPLSFWVGNQSEYDLLVDKSDTTLYLVQ